jgi:hypothetical protein
MRKISNLSLQILFNFDVGWDDGAPYDPEGSDGDRARESGAPTTLRDFNRVSLLQVHHSASSSQVSRAALVCVRVYVRACVCAALDIVLVCVGTRTAVKKTPRLLPLFHNVNEMPPF